MKFLIVCAILLLFQQNFPVTNGLIIPEELQSLLSVVYSNIPPIKKGTDSRVGFGFRLGEHADAQVIIELGPQTETKPLGDGNQNRKRQISDRAEINQLMRVLKQRERHQQEATTGTPASKWLNDWKQKIDEHKQQQKAQMVFTPDMEREIDGIGEIPAKDVIPDDQQTNLDGLLKLRRERKQIELDLAQRTRKNRDMQIKTAQINEDQPKIVTISDETVQKLYKLNEQLKELQEKEASQGSANDNIKTPKIEVQTKPLDDSNDGPVAILITNENESSLDRLYKLYSEALKKNVATKKNTKSSEPESSEVSSDEKPKKRRRNRNNNINKKVEEKEDKIIEGSTLKTPVDQVDQFQGIIHTKESIEFSNKEVAKNVDIKPESESGMIKMEDKTVDKEQEDEIKAIKHF